MTANGIVVLPTYNERANLEKVISGIARHMPELKVLIVDDNSPDGTGDLADVLSQRNPDRIMVLHREKKAGLGKAYIAGFRHVLAAGFEFIVQMDADLSHDPAYLPGMFEALAGCDVVVGSRYVNGISVVNWPLHRLALSTFANRYVATVTGLPLKDATSGYRVWRRSVLEQMDWDKIFSEGYLFIVETAFRAWRAGARIAETPIIFYERQEGASKMASGIVFESAVGVMRLRLLGRSLRPRVARDLSHQAVSAK